MLIDFDRRLKSSAMEYKVLFTVTFIFDKEKMVYIPRKRQSVFENMFDIFI
jgi:hypothetical protein